MRPLISNGSPRPDDTHAVSGRTVPDEAAPGRALHGKAGMNEAFEN